MSEGHHTSTPPPVGALFSTAASDNAEVVPPTSHRAHDGMWTTAANAAQDLDGATEHDGYVDTDNAVVDGVVVDEDVPNDDRYAAPGDPWVNRGGPSTPPPYGGGHPGSVPPGTGGIFSSEPIPRHDDVVEVDDVDERTRPRVPPPGSSADPFRGSNASAEQLFSSGQVTTDAPNPWVATGGDQAQRNGTNGAPSPFVAPAAGSARVQTPRRRATDAPAGRPVGIVRDDVALGTHGDLDDGAVDPNGLREAVSRLDPEAVERAAVPIAVCGALLRTDEWVLGAVTGQMLGRPAVIVVTGTRVLVVNDRRWQPIVDEFRIDASLVVRGRHDRNVAALSFADATRLAMIDGITEVALAIELAERIREAGSV